MGERTTGAGTAADRGGYADGCAFVEEAFVPVGEARIPILDWGFLRSDATYDVAHVWRGRFFRLEDHLDRFERGMSKLRMSIPLGREDIKGVLVECVQRSGLRDAYVEMICTRGLPKPGSRDPRECENRFYAFVVPFIWIADPEKQDKGLRATVSPVERISPESVDPTIKNYHWLDLQRALLDAYDRGGETAILVDRRGNVVEGPGFNVFAARNGRLCTPDRGVLRGVTRKTVVELAEGMGIPLERRPVSADELRHADEALLTSTAGGVMPLTGVDGSPLSDGRPGPLTLRLRDAYWALHEDPRFSSPVSYD